jgi:curli biogenesis system outer membrane secretion channel CsgG
MMFFVKRENEMKMLRKSFLVVVTCFLIVPFYANASFFDTKTKKGEGGTKVTDLTKCAAPIGTAALQEPEIQTYHYLGLKSSPTPMVKLLMSKSKCFKVLARGQAVRSMKTERAFGDDGELQKGSRMGGGQIKAADYIIIPSIVHEDSNAGGKNIGGVLGGFIGGKLGAVAGMLKNKTLEAQVLLEIVDVRTSEQLAIVEGSAKKSDLTFGAGGFFAIAGALGGGYDDTDIGKIVTAAFIDAHNKLAEELGGITPGSAAAADNAGYVISTNVKMRGGPTTKAPDLGLMYEGTSVILTGVENGEWREIEAMGKTGWVQRMYLTR